MDFRIKIDEKTGRATALRLRARTFADERILDLLTRAALSRNAQIEISCDGEPVGSFRWTGEESRP